MKVVSLCLYCISPMAVVVVVVVVVDLIGHNAPNSIECSTRHEINLHLDDHQSYEVMFTEISSTLERHLWTN